jgi:hypothetical protein
MKRKVRMQERECKEFGWRGARRRAHAIGVRDQGRDGKARQGRGGQKRDGAVRRVGRNVR